ncbi:Uncharacterized protein APZ42_031790 [Daphnia magna]|uniref:Uncharacterized protein n=1 Tax=Daphnia magna TaxID=35525 RepID=A0A164MN81_9CRUS|nr:Uncharacterized protein APZ42_031790 [Daphnia magna]
MGMRFAIERQCSSPLQLFFLLLAIRNDIYTTLDEKVYHVQETLVGLA